MRVLAFSDVHRDLGAVEAIVERSADADLVVGVGDFASVHEGLQETLEPLATVEKPLIVVPGNNETEDALRAAAPANARVLHGETAEIDGTTVFGLGAGVPTTPWDWSFDLSEEEAAAKLEACPQDLDLLVVHSPPYGHCDVSGSGDHLGSRAILEAIEAKRPDVVVCGHIHESWGKEGPIIGKDHSGTLVINLGPAGRVVDL